MAQSTQSVSRSSHRRDEAPLKFSNHRSPCPNCGARHGFAALLDHEEGGKCHACGVFVPPGVGSGEREAGSRIVVSSGKPVARTWEATRRRDNQAKQEPSPHTDQQSATDDGLPLHPWTFFRTHDYYDEVGVALFHVDRYHRGGEQEAGSGKQEESNSPSLTPLLPAPGSPLPREKTFRQRPAGVPQRQRDDAEATPIGASMKGVRLVLYELPSILSAMRQGARIWITEGEKAADWLNLHFREELGWPDRATTAPGGSNGWREEFADFLIGADVCVWADADEAGKHHAQSVLDSMNGAVPGVRIIHLDQIPEMPND